MSATQEIITGVVERLMKTFRYKELWAIFFIGLFVLGQPIAVSASYYDEGYNDALNEKKNHISYTFSSKYRNGYEDGLNHNQLDTEFDDDFAMSLIGIAVLFVFLFFGFFIYIIPTLIASTRHHENFGWICFLNLFFGWTGILWVALILWAGLGAKKE